MADRIPNPGIQQVGHNPKEAAGTIRSAQQVESCNGEGAEKGARKPAPLENPPRIEREAEPDSNLFCPFLGKIPLFSVKSS